MSQQQMSDEMGIPKRTIEDWKRGVRNCPEWTEIDCCRTLSYKIEKNKYHNCNRDTQWDTHWCRWLENSGLLPAS